MYGPKLIDNKSPSVTTLAPGMPFLTILRKMFILDALSIWSSVILEIPRRYGDTVTMTTGTRIGF